jgi:hypothetical protein
MVLWCFVELSFKGPYTQPSAYLQRCSVCDPAKMFFTSKFSCLLFFSNATHKTETGTANRWETPNQTTWTDHFQKHWASSQIIFITLISAGAQRCCAFYKPVPTVHIYGAKTISWVELACFHLLSSNFTHVAHTLTTAGDGLLHQFFP